MKYSFLLLLFLVVFTKALHAQNNGKVTGSITSNQKREDLSGSTISLLHAKDSAVVKLTVAGKNGLFSFESITSGKYLVAVTAVGHQKEYSPHFQIATNVTIIQLPALLLKPLSQSLKAVTVTAKRPPIEQKADRMLINVEASVTNIGATALEVLEKSPGVNVDREGNISLKGKEGVLILVDNRPTQLGGADLANLLRNMSADQLDQIEIMTNPPARYDAAGNAGIINIKTKKNKTSGYNGSANVGFTQGRYPKVNEGFNFNYREGKINVFTNFNHSYRKNFDRLTIQRNLRDGANSAPEQYFDQQADDISTGNSYNAKVGVDYFANKKTTVGLALSGFSNTNATDKTNETYISTSSKELQNITRATVANESRWKNKSINLYFRNILDTTGKEITSDFDFITYDSKNSQFMVNSYFDAEGNFFQRPDTLQGLLPQNIKIYSGRADYVHPLKKGAKLEAGLKSSLVKTDNNAVYDSIQNGSMVHDFGRSNHFVYEENINAAYVTVNAPLSKKVNGQLGLRLENTNAKGVQLTTGEIFSRHYTQLFPTAYLQYKANEKHNLVLNYGRRIRRPDYESLNPFIRFIDRYTYNKGNPNLKPQFSNNLELTHGYRNKLSTTLNYSATNDIIQGVIEQKGQEAYATRANIASLRQYGAAVSLNTPVTKWWTNSFYFNIFNNHFEGIVNGAAISFSATSFSINGSQQFKLSKTLTAEINGGYRSAGVHGVVYTRPRGVLSAGFSQQVMKTKGNLRLTVRDIFYTQRSNASTRYGNVDASFQNVGDSRVVSLAFSYLFSKGKLNNQKKRTPGSAGEEQDRISID